MQWHCPILVFTFCVAAAFAPSAVAQHEHGSSDAAALGSVNFPTSCLPAVQSDFNRAVALLHSFWYKKSEETFLAVAKADSSCGMAEWDVAMTHYRQLWDPPTPIDLQAGSAAVQKANATGAKTQRERDYIAAMDIFYKDSDKRPHAARALDYEKSMERIYERYPQDLEAAVFYALAVRANRRQNVREPEKSERHPRKTICRISRPPRLGSLHHPLRRLPCSGSSGP
jgi:hypothetical protein